MFGAIIPPFFNHQPAGIIGDRAYLYELLVERILLNYPSLEDVRGFRDRLLNGAKLVKSGKFKEELLVWKKRLEEKLEKRRKNSTTK